MSTDLYWRPAPRVIPPGNELPHALKRTLAKRLWGHDGSLNGDAVEVDKAFIPYLEGLADAEVAGARELINAIHEHGDVELFIRG